MPRAKKRFDAAKDVYSRLPDELREDYEDIEAWLACKSPGCLDTRVSVFRQPFGPL